jgi:DNA-binding transcriptional regulator GbsR (MarR family)
VLLLLIIIEKDKERTAELEKHKKLIEDQKRAYNDILSSVNEDYARTPQGQREDLVKRLEKTKKIMKDYYGV